MTQFKKAIKGDEMLCDICGGVMYPVYGSGWDYDRFECTEKDCKAEIIYPTSTEMLETYALADLIDRLNDVRATFKLDSYNYEYISQAMDELVQLKTGWSSCLDVQDVLVREYWLVLNKVLDLNNELKYMKAYNGAIG